MSYKSVKHTDLFKKRSSKNVLKIYAINFGHSSPFQILPPLLLPSPTPASSFSLENQQAEQTNQNFKKWKNITHADIQDHNP